MVLGCAFGGQKERFKQEIPGSGLAYWLIGGP